MNGIEGSVLMNDYERIKKLPTVDSLLDFRIRLAELKEQNKEASEWYDKEVKAVDYLLSKHDN